ncbi:ATPase [Erythrobacter sp. SG61-1L]|nr:ATPase [Erythrobacter sp. SG61-1L]
MSATEAAATLATEGPNELPADRQRGLRQIIGEVLREPMLALLLTGGLIYLALGDLQEALLLIAFAGFSIVVTTLQEARSEKALAALRDLGSPRALVIRDGERIRIAGRDVVRGDLVVLNEGDRVPADGHLLRCDGLTADESLLTGESVPVAKSATTDTAETPRPGGDGLPFVWSGTLVVRGSGIARITATGPRSEMGRIGMALHALEPEVPRLRRQTQRLVFWFGALGASACVLAILLYGFLRGSWLDAALAGIALGMSMLPEEFPVVLTVFMAMGAMRLSRVNVLTRRAAAIETLGSATTLCTDKTGTLTENRMQVAELRLPDGRTLDFPGDPLMESDFALLARFGILASAEQPVDPMEVAFHELAGTNGGNGLMDHRDNGWSLQRHYPLDPSLLAMSHAWRGNGSDGLVIASKGAPEAIAELCGMLDDDKAKMRAQADAMAEKGLRVLGVAEASWSGSELPADQRRFEFRFLGLAGLADPLRASVPGAVRQCREAGIRVVMITGDYPSTASAIAQQAGIETGDVLSGEELAAMSDAELAARIGKVNVFARIMPEQKLRLVDALKARGEIVAMTGDGVNDAPSLKSAHIGIAMGKRGTDVAREAASIVLLDDDFGSIVTGIRIGRKINDNLRKALAFIVAVHIPIAGLALLPLFAGMPLMLAPIHIAFIEMIIDPVCSLAFEAEKEERRLMQRPPRAPDAPLFPRWMVAWAALQGIVAMAVIGGVTLYAWSAGLGEERVRTIAFLSLVLGILGLILVNRSYSASVIRAVIRPNRPLATVALAVFAILALSQFAPPVTELFRFAKASWSDLALVAGTSFATLLLLETVKPWWRTRLFPEIHH